MPAAKPELPLARFTMPDLRRLESHSADLRLSPPVVLLINGIGEKELRLALRRRYPRGRSLVAALLGMTG